MKINRRQMLTKLAKGGAAFGAGAAVAPSLAKVALTVKGQETVPVLTPDGELMHVLRSQMKASPAKAVTDPAVRRGVPGRKWIMVIDLAKCAGLKKCTAACNAMHFTNQEWIKVYDMKDSPETAPYFFPKPCFHCDNPPCTKVCPVGATFKREDGVVLIDNTRCIGCRFCMAACPYSTRHFNWGPPDVPDEAREFEYSPERGFPARKGTVAKCDFCPDMAAAGHLPACVQACPNGVIYYGDQNEDTVTNSLDETLQFTKLLEERAGYRFLEELGTEPRVYYLPPKNRKFTAPSQTVTN